MRFGVWGFGFGVRGVEFEVVAVKFEGVGFGGSISEFIVCCLGLRSKGLGGDRHGELDPQLSEGLEMQNPWPHLISGFEDSELLLLVRVSVMHNRQPRKC